MDQLAPEVLGLIAGHLDDQRSLHSFSLSNRRCRASAVPYIFSTCSIKFDSPESLATSTEKTIRWLETTSSQKHVRHFRVIDYRMPHRSYWYSPFRYRSLWNRPHEDRSITAMPLLFQDRPSPLRLDEHWSVLHDLFKRLPAVQEVTWACEDLMPPCILRIIHTLAPRPRVNLMRLDLPSLFSADGKPPCISSHELELATSPCLYSVDRNTYHRNNNDHNEKALFEMVARGDLKHLCLRWHSGPGEPHDMWANEQARRHPRHPWQQGTIQSTPSSIGSLESVSLVNMTISAINMASSVLRSLVSCTDFSALRALSLYTEIDSSTIQWLSESCKFPNLEHLSIGWQKEVVSVAFLKTLPPLRSLCLYDRYDTDSLYEIFRHCGQRLRTLRCKSNFIDTRVITELSQTCPRIEHLAFCMSRSAGSAEELATYHGIGRLAALRRAELDIRPHQDLPEVKDIHTPEACEQLYHILVDTAIDRPLASAIYHAIASARPAHATPFEHLQLSTSSRFKFDFQDILRFFGRSWQCIRWLGNDQAGTQQCIIADDFDLCERRERVLTLERDRFASILNLELREAIYRAWPQSRERPLEEVWHGFPLYDETSSDE